MRTRSTLVTIVACAFSIAGMTQPSAAAIVNGDFELGNLTGWSGQGNVSLRGSQGNWYAYLYAEYEPGFTNVSTLSQRFTAEQGDILDTNLYHLKLNSFSGNLSAQLISLPHVLMWVDYNNDQIRLPVSGQYTLVYQVDASFEYAGASVDNVRLIPYGSLDNPVLPTTTTPIPNDNPIFSFVGVRSGAWFDPPSASAFEYQMTSSSLFTQILDFPTGFDQPFTVTANGIDLGQFSPGQSVDFTSFAGGGVSSFYISGISPLADPADPLAFPIKLAFNTSTADFTMQAVSIPELGSILMAGAATLAGLAELIARQRRDGSGVCA